jgi:serine/threonine protein phosphatase 1
VTAPGHRDEDKALITSRIAPIKIPDEFTVWAASDVHGQLRAVDRLLRAAGLTDGADRWVALSATALVVTGDVVDRGPDSLRLVRRLASLRAQAGAAGGLVAILGGNHEAQVLGGLGGQPQIFRALMAFGGGATLLSAGLRPDEWEGRSPVEIAARVDELAPDLRPTLWTFAPYARWGDVLLVHGGPVPNQELDRFERSADRLWIRDGFFASPDRFPDAAAWAPYRKAGMGQVVFGHTPVDGPTLFHAGHALNLDTWRGKQVTLARLDPGRELRDAVFLSEPAEPRAIADAPVSAEEIRRFDAELPAVVDAWVAGRPVLAVQPAGRTTSYRR